MISRVFEVKLLKGLKLIKEIVFEKEIDMLLIKTQITLKRKGGNADET